MSPAPAGGRIAPLTFCLVFAMAAAYADTPPPTDADGDSSLDPVVVTATRTAQPLDRTGSSMSVITGTDLDTRQLLFVSDALAQAAQCVQIDRSAWLNYMPSAAALAGMTRGVALTWIVLHA